MKRALMLTVLLLAACSPTKKEPSPYASVIGQAVRDADTDAVFQSVEDHARCAGFHRAFAGVATASSSKARFFDAAADHAEMAATEIATASISKELASSMVEELASSHAARWAYLIEADSKSNAVQSQADRCFDMASQQEVIIRDAIKSKYGFRRP